MKTLKTTMFVTACMAMMCACTDPSTLDENQGSNESNELVELKINPSIALTRAAVAGTDGKVLKDIAVYSSGTENNYAIYKYSDASGSGNWGINGSDKIYLSKEAVTIFAYYPAYSDTEGNTALKINESGTPSASSTINVSLNGGADSAGDDNKIIVASGATTTINTAEKDIDYMYAVDGGTQVAESNTEEKQPTASSTEGSSSVSLKMKHAMAAVSFKVQIDKYDKEGKLTKIVLKNTSESATTLNKGTSSTATMNISSGAITITGSSAATFTRFIYTDTSTPSAAGVNLYAEGGPTEGYILTKGTASPAFSILTYPDNITDKSTVTVEVTIDGQTYSKALPNNTSPSQAWAAGKNHVYTLKLSGKELGITNVTIESWGTDVTMGDVTLE